MKYNIIGLLWCMLYVSSSYAQYFVDVFGASDVEQKRLLSSFTQRVIALEKSKYALIMQHPKNLDKIAKPLYLKNKQLLEDIKKDGNFLYADIETVYYPDLDKYFSTIEVINKQDAQRSPYVNMHEAKSGIATQPTQKSVVKNEVSNNQSADDLITKMQKFSDETTKLILHHKIAVSMNLHDCPVYHCVVGFDHPKLKPYLEIFNHGVQQEKDLIIKTLQQDPIAERRAAAAFLVGHFPDPHAIITTLLPYVCDKDAGVRNNVLRVLGTTLQKSQITDLDPLPFLQLLYSPYVTDRNKSLLILFSLADASKVQHTIIKYGEQILLENLALKQPNNHIFAYKILQKISHQSLGEYDLDAWHRWFKHAQAYT